MKNDGYYILFFIFIGLLIIIFYNQSQTPLQPMRLSQQHTQQQQPSLHKYHTEQDQQMNKKTNKEDYTYNIENINIHKDNLNLGNNENKLGLGTANAANSKYEPELEEVYNTTLRGDEYDTQSSDELFNYSIKPNKSDLPIVNPPLQLLMSNAPLRLSERHLA